MKAALLMGSDSDLPRLQGALDVFTQLKISCEVRVLSAHRTPEDLKEYVKSAPGQGVSIFLAAAGGAAHLAGTVAALTQLPVLGIPLDNPPLGGMDALLSTVQMPAGIPVATFAVGGGGAANAAIFAARVLALKDENVKTALDKYHADMVKKVREKDAAVRKKSI